MSCRHGFVVRDIVGGNRFLCRECDTRFARYPQKPSWQRELNERLRWEALNDTLKDVYQDDFVERMNKKGYVVAQGAPMGQQITYNLPLTDKATMSFAFLGDDDE